MRPNANAGYIETVGPVGPVGPVLGGQQPRQADQSVADTYRQSDQSPRCFTVPLYYFWLPRLPQVFRQIGQSKESRPNSDTADLGVWSESTLFATRPVVLGTLSVDLFKKKKQD